MDSRYEQLFTAARALVERPRSKKALAVLEGVVTRKQCRACLQSLPLASFGVQMGAFDGLRPHCKKCRSEARL